MTLASIHTAARLPPLYLLLYGGLRAYFSIFIYFSLVNVLLCCHFCIMATDQRRYHLHLIALEILNEVFNDASSARWWWNTCTTVMKGRVVVGRKKVMIFFQNNVVNEEWLSHSLGEWKYDLYLFLTVLIKNNKKFNQGCSIMYAPLSCAMLRCYSLNWENYRKKCKYINCSKFLWHVACTKPSS